ncbi:DUF1127 domain-containing protein [Terrarubrum flagellatum]|uniref:DUF1127 domain-containing protein n=1 Tax=Terrirubrum flagellatum TaxID=2895980 RepID=UPI0031455DD7
MTLTLTTMRSFGSLAHALREAALTGMRKSDVFFAARRNRRAVINLADCDDRMLKDIGLTRAEVEGALEVGFSEDPSAILRRESGIGAFERNEVRSRQTLRPSVIPVVQGYAQGIA